MDHVHFLILSVPTYSVTKLVTIIKSLTAREILRRCSAVKKQLWGGEFWTDGYFANTVGRQGDEQTIGVYVKAQGQAYGERDVSGRSWLPASGRTPSAIEREIAVVGTLVEVMSLGANPH